MIFNSFYAPKVSTERFDYLNPPAPSERNGIPPAPRCSLDFRVELDDGTILDDTIFRIQQFQGHEAFSQLFEYQIELRANDFFSSGQAQPWGPRSGQPYGAELNGQNSVQLDFSTLIGAKASILLGLPETDRDVYDSAYPGQRPVVCYSGIISNFAIAERGVYHATVKPALCKLQMQNNYRLFSQQTILQVVMQVLSENNISYNKRELEQKPNKIVTGLANYRKQDWLQAGESDFDFIQRLMQKVNLSFYFVHDLFEHSMIVTDQPYYQTLYQREVNESGFSRSTDQIKPLYLSYSQQASLERDDYITQFKFQQNLTTAGISTVLAQKEAVWESQNTAQVSPVFRNQDNARERLNMEQIHLVQYGASEQEVQALTDTAVNRLAATRYEFSGATSCPELKPGFVFEVREQGPQSQTNAERSLQGTASYNGFTPIRPGLDKQRFVATSVQHQATAEGHYQCQFSAVSASGLALPFQPGQGGSIMAMVVDKPASPTLSGSSVSAAASFGSRHTGSSAKYLEKNSFAYDGNTFMYSLSTGDQSYHCRGVYVRFIDRPDNAAPIWIKLADHMQTIPETGTYVMISRSQDDNEVPEVQQIVQAKGSKVIMPDNYTCNTNVGDSYNTNYGNSTRISFGGDIATPLASAKQIVEAKRQSGNYNDVSFSESSSYNFSVTAKSHSVSLTGSGSWPDFDAADMQNYVSYHNGVTRGDSYQKSFTEGNSYSESTTRGNNERHDTQIGNTTSVNVQTGDTSSTSTTTGNTTRHDTINGTVTSTTTQNGATHSESNQTGGSYSKSTIDTSNNINIVGASTSESVTGAHNGTDVTGASTSESLTGVTNSVAIVGNTSSVAITGASEHVSVTGADVRIGVTGSSTSVNVTTESTSVEITTSGVAFRYDGRPDAKIIGPEVTILEAIKLVL